MKSATKASTCLLVALGLFIGSCGKSPSSGPGADLAEQDSADGAGSGPVSESLVPVEEQAQILMTERLSEAIPFTSPHAMKPEDIATVEAEGLELSDEEWRTLQALAAPPPW